MAYLAQPVNVIAPIMTENNGSAWLQTIFYPFMYASLYGRGTVLQAKVKCDNYKSKDNFTVPYIAASVINNKEKRELTVFAVNRSLDSAVELSLSLTDFENSVLTEHVELYSDNLKAADTDKISSVYPSNKEIGEKIILNKHSWNMLRYKY